MKFAARLSPSSWALLALVLTLANVQAPDIAAAADPKPKTVSMVVDYDDGVQVHFTALAYREEMTVFDALTAASTHKHGITFSHRGSGELAMLTKLGEVKNEGGGEKSRNWMFYVNAKSAKSSMGVTKLQPGD